jgi:hypothetical protein
MNILNKHLYHTSEAENQDKPVITIPFSMLQHVISAHEKQQNYFEISCNIKKCPYDGGDLYEKKNREDVAGEIEYLKKPHVEDA